MPSLVVPRGAGICDVVVAAVGRRSGPAPWRPPPWSPSPAALFAGAFFAADFFVAAMPSRPPRRVIERGTLSAAPRREGARSAVRPTRRTATSGVSVPASSVTTATASVSAAISSSWARAASIQSASAVIVSSMRSVTARSASRRACWTRRIRSRARPSCSSSGVTSTSSTMTPVPPPIVVLGRSPSATIVSVNSPGSSQCPPATTRSPSSVQSPALTARMTSWVCRPRRGPIVAGTTCSTWPATAPTSSVSATSRTLTSSAMMSTNGASRSASGTATVSVASGWRTRRPWALRTDSVAEQTSRTSSIAATSSSSAGSSSSDGQSREVHARRRAARGAARRGSPRRRTAAAARRPARATSSTVCSVSMASCVAVPEALAAAADVPVREHVDERPHPGARPEQVVGVHRRRHARRRAGGSWPGRSGRARARTPRPAGRTVPLVAGDVGVQGEEVPRVPQRQQHLAGGVAQPGRGHREVVAAQDRRRQQVPAHGVGAVGCRTPPSGPGSCAGSWTSSARRRRARCRG